VHADATAISIRSSRGVVIKRQVVITNATALRRALATARGRVKVVCEVGPLAVWIKTTLETTLREVIVCDRRRLSSFPEALRRAIKSMRIGCRKHFVSAEFTRSTFPARRC